MDIVFEKKSTNLNIFLKNVERKERNPFERIENHFGYFENTLLLLHGVKQNNLTGNVANFRLFLGCVLWVFCEDLPIFCKVLISLIEN